MNNWMGLLSGGALGAVWPGWAERFNYMLPEDMKVGKAPPQRQPPSQGPSMQPQQLPQQQMPPWLMGLGGQF